MHIFSDEKHHKDLPNMGQGDTLVGDRTDDVVIELLEDITDSVSNEKGFTQEDIDNAVSEIEKKWREKYIARFSGKVTEEEEEEEEE